MGYIIGVSSGMFMAAEAAEKLQFITMPQKMFYGTFKGCNFTQIDLESITEFKEPDLEKEVEKIRKIGIRIGVHGESYAMGGAERPIGMLDSAIETEYIHSHERLIQHIEGCGRIGAEYVNIHPSETTPFLRLGVHLQPTRLVDPWGRPLKKFLEENKWLFEWTIESPLTSEIFMHGYRSITLESAIENEKRDLKRKEKRELTSEEIKEIEEYVKQHFKNQLINFVTTDVLTYGSERLAYFIVAKWMQHEGDALWTSIVGKRITDDDLFKLDSIQKWVPAVSAKYIWGHFNPTEKQFKDPKSLLQKHKMYFVFESQMGSAGIEGMYRICRPRDMVFLCSAIKSEWVGVCFDFEHVLSQNIDPKKEIESFPGNGGKWVKVCHLGWPTPHVPAHAPLFLGSKQQLWVYERLYELRKKGFEDGYLIFERAGPIGGGDPVQQSILVLRLIKKFLEKDTEPKELPEEFFGLQSGGPDVKRQELAIREHALDPLKGLLMFPEEEFTFLSAEAAKKGKGEEWKREKYK